MKRSSILAIVLILVGFLFLSIGAAILMFAAILNKEFVIYSFIFFGIGMLIYCVLIIYYICIYIKRKKELK